jgi:hypothetical protein
MKPEKPIDRLRSLRKEIASLCIVKCHMSHERIRRVGEFRLPIVSRLPGGGYQRVCLCSPEVRAQRLGCSHTTARIKLQEAINELNIGHGNNDGQVSELAVLLNRLDNQIHLLDHRKSEAEKNLAKIEEQKYRTGDQANKVEELTGAKKIVLEMQQLHDKYVEQIGVLRDRVLNSLDRLIQQVEMNQSAGVMEQ